MNAIFICVIVLDQMCFHMLNSCWSNTKRFLSILVVFGKYFVFVKMSKIFKNSVALFWRLSRGLVQSHVLVASPHRDFLRLIGRLIPQSRKILRIFFRIWVFNVPRDSVLRLARDLTQSQKLHVLRKSVSFLNIFSFPSNICDYSLSFLSEPLSKS